MKTTGMWHLFPLAGITSFFALGIFAGDALSLRTDAWAWIVATVIMLAITVMLHGKAGLQTVMIFASCFFAGGSMVSSWLECRDRHFPGDEVVYKAVVASPPAVHGKVVMCDVIVTGVRRPFKLRASILRDDRASSLCIGDGIEASSVMEKPHNYESSRFDYASYLVRHGYSGQTFIYKTGWQKDSSGVQGLPLAVRAKIAALQYREQLLAHYRRLGMSGDVYSVVAAMTLGDRNGMTAELRDTYSVSGASHILALSGLHLGIIYAMLSCLFVWRRNRILCIFIVIPVIWAYVFLTGLSPSTIRSAVMITIHSVAAAYNRDRMSLNALAAAALLMLAVTPCDLFDAGFQMSFMAVFFILVFYQPIYNKVPATWRANPIAARVWQMSAVSVAAQIGVAPLIMLYFGRFSCYFLITNIIVVPAAALVLYCAAALLLLAFLPAVQQLVAHALMLVVEFLNTSVGYMSALPGADISGITLNTLQVWLIYALIFMLYGLLRIVHVARR